MRQFLLVTFFLLSATSAFAVKGLKIADSVIYAVPYGWSHTDSSQETMDGLGVLTKVELKNSDTRETLTISVLNVNEGVVSGGASTDLIESTLSPLIEAYRKKGSHYYPRKILGRDNLVYYSQEVGRLDARKVELRGILLSHGENWVNFFCVGPKETSWARYRDLINGTRLIK